MSKDRSSPVSLSETGDKRFGKCDIGEALADAGLLAEAHAPQTALVEAELAALREERDAARSDLAALSSRIQEAQRVNPITGASTRPCGPAAQS